MKAEIKRVYVKYGMNEDKADICAQVHTDSSCDGVTSHGTNRVPVFIKNMQQGGVNVNADPTLEKSLGAIEVYNGNLAPGVLNGIFSIDRAMEIAKEHGVGIVAMKNTNHWMRGGTYGLRAARKGFISISWTNTEPQMPPWGGTEMRLGNNPFVMACPGPGGEPYAVDMAVSLYSNGQLQTTRLAGKKLPYPGGFNAEGELTDIPAEIEATRRVLPMGYWKGSSFSFMLDIVGAILSDGSNVTELAEKNKGSSCVGCSQIYMAITPEMVSQERMIEIITNTTEFVKTSPPMGDGTRILYPGEDFALARAENMANGVFVDDGIWAQIQAL